MKRKYFISWVQKWDGDVSKGFGSATFTTDIDAYEKTDEFLKMASKEIAETLREEFEDEITEIVILNFIEVKA